MLPYAYVGMSYHPVVVYLLRLARSNSSRDAHHYLGFRGVSPQADALEKIDQDVQCRLQFDWASRLHKAIVRIESGQELSNLWA